MNVSESDIRFIEGCISVLSEQVNDYKTNQDEEKLLSLYVYSDTLAQRLGKLIAPLTHRNTSEHIYSIEQWLLENQNNTHTPLPLCEKTAQLHGKEISYNNLLDITAAVDLIDEFDEVTFAILKHNNACGLASRPVLLDAWKAALAGDPVSAFGGVLITNAPVDKETAEAINELFFEVIIAPDYDLQALDILCQKKNRIILTRKPQAMPKLQFRTAMNGILVQEKDSKTETPDDLRMVTSRMPSDEEIQDMLFANKIVKNSKSNSIVFAKNRQLLASGVGQTSRVDALKQAVDKAHSFGFDLNGAAMASDAYFPFPDCVELADQAGVRNVIHPGGSIRDDQSIDYCEKHGMTMAITGFRHFKH